MAKDIIFDNILKNDPRYKMEAYIFVLESLYYAREKFKVERHVTGRQLLEGIKELALKRFGSLAKMVFEHWGVKKTIDFGNIVFNMVNEGILSKTDEDKIEDFVDVYDFEEVFVKNYKLDLIDKSKISKC
ncbi:MAG: Minf_1886 family protein [candidate division WOR-3 bacterium]